MLVNCLNCNKEFNKKVSQIKKSNNHFCSRSCNVSYNNRLNPKRKLQGACEVCSGPCSGANKKCGLCTERAKLGTRELTLSSMEDLYRTAKRPAGWKNAKIRDFGRAWNKELLGSNCQVCNYSKHVELCHIKPISSYSQDTKLSEINHPDNIAVLCRNCHWELDNNLISPCTWNRTRTSL